jgi:predicted lipid-binding transport protein (Tim44 family)
VEKREIRRPRKKQERKGHSEFYGLGFGLLGMGLVTFVCLVSFDMHAALQDFFAILMLILIGAGLLFLIIARLTKG